MREPAWSKKHFLSVFSVRTWRIKRKLIIIDLYDIIKKVKPFVFFDDILGEGQNEEKIMEDFQIVELYWARSESAIVESSRKYGNMLKGISYSLVTSAEDAEECVSDTYLAAWERMPEDRPVYLGSFLAKIVRRLSIDRFRCSHRQKRGGMNQIISELTDCIPSNENVEHSFENGMLAGTLNRFLYSLDGEKRAIFVRRYFYSHSLSTIAADMKMSEGKLKSILFRLRAGLRTVLEKEELL